MTKTALAKIKAGLDDAIAFAQGDDSRGVVHAPDKVDVKAIRKQLGLTQTEFGRRYGFNPARIRDWEQGRSWPDSAARAYLIVIQREREAVDRALHAA